MKLSIVGNTVNLQWLGYTKLISEYASGDAQNEIKRLRRMRRIEFGGLGENGGSYNL
jgi:hypothetical protein